VRDRREPSGKLWIGGLKKRNGDEGEKKEAEGEGKEGIPWLREPVYSWGPLPTRRFQQKVRSLKEKRGAITVEAGRDRTSQEFPI